MNILQQLFRKYQFHPIAFDRLFKWTDENEKEWEVKLSFTFDSERLILDDVFAASGVVQPNEENPADVIPDDVIEDERKELEKELIAALDERNIIQGTVRAALIEDEHSAYESAVREISETLGMDEEDDDEEDGD